MNTKEGAEIFFTDGRGSVSETVNRQTRSVTTYTYDAFGNVEVEGNSTNHLTYNQEWFDFSTGLQFLRARYVDLELGRFISRDTVLGTMEDPRTHNLYLYVQNDPLNFIDPSGHVAHAGGGGGSARNCGSCNNGRNLTWILPVCLVCRRTRSSSLQKNVVVPPNVQPSRPPTSPPPPPPRVPPGIQNAENASARSHFTVCEDIRRREVLTRVRMIDYVVSGRRHNPRHCRTASWTIPTIATGVLGLLAGGPAGAVAAYKPVGAAKLKTWLASQSITATGAQITRILYEVNYYIVTGMLKARKVLPGFIAMRTNTTYTLFISIDYVSRLRDDRSTFITRRSMISRTIDHRIDRMLQRYTLHYGFGRDMSIYKARSNNDMANHINRTAITQARNQVDRYQIEAKRNWNRNNTP